jgi:hypothetical protein
MGYLPASMAPIHVSAIIKDNLATLGAAPSAHWHRDHFNGHVHDSSNICVPINCV